MSHSHGVPFGEIAKEQVFIAVMGVTGSGKSTFVQLATGSDEAVVGDGLASCTQKPLILPVPAFGDNVYLIDTPGFDDTYKQDADVLQEVATCLQVLYTGNVKLRGIIYMHRISDPRMTSGGMRNLAMFRKLCGPEPLKNVILATTFWGKVTEGEGVARENQLRSDPDFWADMIEDGARTARFDNTQESAFKLIQNLAKRPPVALQIQREMCDDGKLLAQTEAGEEVNGKLAKMIEKHAKEMQGLQRQLQDTKDADEKLKTTLERELTKSSKKIDKLQEQQEVLKANRRNEMRVLEQEWDRRMRRMEAGKNTETDSELKEKLAAAKVEDSKPEPQRKNYIKYAKVAGAVTSTGLNIAACVVNPFNAGAAVLSFVKLVNLIMQMSGGDATLDVDSS